MGTEYFKVAEPVSRLRISETPAYTFIKFRVGAAESGQLTIPTETASEFIRLFRGEHIGKISFPGKETGRIFIPMPGFNPDHNTQLISDTGEVIYYDVLIRNLNS